MNQMSNFNEFPCKNGTFTLEPKLVKDWIEVYPGLDVPAHLMRAWSWCVSNRSKRKTVRGMPKFLNGWLGRNYDAQVMLGRGKAKEPPADRDAPGYWGDLSFNQVVEASSRSKARAVQARYEKERDRLREIASRRGQVV